MLNPNPIPMSLHLEEYHLSFAYIAPTFARGTYYIQREDQVKPTKMITFDHNNMIDCTSSSFGLLRVSLS